MMTSWQLSWHVIYLPRTCDSSKILFLVNAQYRSDPSADDGGFSVGQISLNHTHAAARTMHMYCAYVIISNAPRYRVFPLLRATYSISTWSVFDVCFRSNTRLYSWQYVYLIIQSVYQILIQGDDVKKWPFLYLFYLNDIHTSNNFWHRRNDWFTSSFVISYVCIVRDSWLYYYFTHELCAEVRVRVSL